MSYDKLVDQLSEAEAAIAAAQSHASKLRPEDTRKAAINAIAEIRRGAYADTITTLEREFLPKWSSRPHCERDLLRAAA